MRDSSRRGPDSTHEVLLPNFWSATVVMGGGLGDGPEIMQGSARIFPQLKKGRHMISYVKRLRRGISTKAAPGAKSRGGRKAAAIRRRAPPPTPTKQKNGTHPGVLSSKSPTKRSICQARGRGGRERSY